MRGIKNFWVYFFKYDSALYYTLPHQLWAGIHSLVQQQTADGFRVVAEALLTIHLFLSVSVQPKPQTAAEHHTPLLHTATMGISHTDIQSQHTLPVCRNKTCTFLFCLCNGSQWYSCCTSQHTPSIPTVGVSYHNLTPNSLLWFFITSKARWPCSNITVLIRNSYFTSTLVKPG